VGPGVLMDFTSISSLASLRHALRVLHADEVELGIVVHGRVAGRPLSAGISAVYSSYDEIRCAVGSHAREQATAL